MAPVRSHAQTDTIGDDPVLLPGEPEHQTAVERRANGTSVEANVGAELQALATHYDLVSKLPSSLG